jgi:YVTN family beta-propeller protein
VNDLLTYALVGLAIIAGLVLGWFYMQTYTVSGYVMNFNGQPINNAEIVFGGNYSSVYTNDQGYWVKSGLKGKVVVGVVMTGWRFTPPVTVNENRSNVDFFGIQQRVMTIFPVGQKPRDILIDPQNGKGYVTVSGENSVDVFDLNNYNILSKISVGMTPWGIVLDKNNGKIYVSNFGGNTITVIDEKSDKVVSNIKVGNEPLGIAIDEKTDMIYVANNLDNTVSVIDGKTNQVLETVNVGRSPSDIAVNEKDNIIYITNSGNDTVSVLNGATSMVMNTLKVGMNPAAITINPENGMVYVLNIYDGTISVIDGFNVIKTIDLKKGVDNIAFDPLVNAIYVTDSNDNALIFINAQTGSIVKKLSVGTEPFGIAIGPNDEIYISNYGNSTISVIN